MAVRTHRPATPAEAKPAANAAPVDWTADWTRQQMVVATEGASALYRGFQAMRGIQEQAAQHAAQRHAAVAEKLRQATTPAELFALQGELLRSDVESVAQYWQQLAGATLEMNTELIGCASHLVETEDIFGAAAARFLHS